MRNFDFQSFIKLVDFKKLSIKQNTNSERSFYGEFLKIMNAITFLVCGCVRDIYEY